MARDLDGFSGGILGSFLNPSQICSCSEFIPDEIYTKAVGCSILFYGHVRTSYVCPVFYWRSAELSTVFLRFFKDINKAVDFLILF